MASGYGSRLACRRGAEDCEAYPGDRGGAGSGGATGQGCVEDPPGGSALHRDGGWAGVVRGLPALRGRWHGKDTPVPVHQVGLPRLAAGHCSFACEAMPCCTPGDCAALAGELAPGLGQGYWC